jgi:hypothetical protein
MQTGGELIPPQHFSGLWADELKLKAFPSERCDSNHHHHHHHHHHSTAPTFLRKHTTFSFALCKIYLDLPTNCFTSPSIPFASCRTSTCAQSVFLFPIYLSIYPLDRYRSITCLGRPNSASSAVSPYEIPSEGTPGARANRQHKSAHGQEHLSTSKGLRILFIGLRANNSCQDVVEENRPADGYHQALLGFSCNWREFEANGPIWGEAVNRQVTIACK